MKVGDLVKISRMWNGYAGNWGVITQVAQDATRLDLWKAHIRLRCGRMIYVHEEYIEVISESR